MLQPLHSTRRLRRFAPPGPCSGSRSPLQHPFHTGMVLWRASVRPTGHGLALLLQGGAL